MPSFISWVVTWRGKWRRSVEAGTTGNGTTSRSISNPGSNFRVEIRVKLGFCHAKGNNYRQTNLQLFGVTADIRQLIYTVRLQFAIPLPTPVCLKYLKSHAKASRRWWQQRHHYCILSGTPKLQIFRLRFESSRCFALSKVKTIGSQTCSCFELQLKSVNVLTIFYSCFLPSC